MGRNMINNLKKRSTQGAREAVNRPHPLGALTKLENNLAFNKMS